jgi:hypothetical protein
MLLNINLLEEQLIKLHKFIYKYLILPQDRKNELVFAINLTDFTILPFKVDLLS